MNDDYIESTTSEEQVIKWLADVPLFLDERQVTNFYDAVVRPEFEKGTVRLNCRVGTSSKRTKGGETGGEVSSGFLPFLSTFLPGIKINAKAGYEKATERAQQDERSVELSSINNPHRQLIHLALHYESNLPERWMLVEDLGDERWRSESFISALPRALVFLDVREGTPIIPIALEGNSGSVRLVFPALSTGDDELPKYPEWMPNADMEKLKQDRRDYWRFFGSHYSDTRAMKAIESEIRGEQTIRWIDFRIPVNGAGDTLHLHAQVRNEYDTGTFAYNLIKRGFKHGIRLVGTLKSEPDLNVLAIFEK